MCYHFVLNFAYYGRIGELDVCGKGRIWYKTTDKCLWSTYDFRIFMISFVKLFLPLLVLTFLVYIKINMLIFLALSQYILAGISYMQCVMYVQESQNLGKVFLSNIRLVSYSQFVLEAMNMVYWCLKLRFLGTLA